MLLVAFNSYNNNNLEGIMIPFLQVEKPGLENHVK